MNNGATLIDWIASAMGSDDADTSDQSSRLATLYGSATDAEKAVLDNAFICLCGWSLGTAIKRAAPQITGDHK